MLLKKVVADELLSADDNMACTSDLDYDEETDENLKFNMSRVKGSYKK